MVQAPLGINVGTSVLKREAKPISQVKSNFKSNGWEVTADLLGGRLVYVEKNGINLTLLSGPVGTVVFPSGPIRGAAFGDEAVSLNRVSSTGGSKDVEEPDKSDSGRVGKRFT